MQRLSVEEPTHGDRARGCSRGEFEAKEWLSVGGHGLELSLLG